MASHTSTTSQYKNPWVETPLIESTSLSREAGCRIFLKLELLQPSGSFKSRGIGNLILAHLSDPSIQEGKQKVHFFSSSGGNAGLAAVIAARDLGYPCTVVVPHSTKPVMVQKLRDAGATEVIQHGANWSEADTYLKETFIDGISEEHVDSNAEKMAKGKATNTTLTGRVYRSEAPHVALAGGTNGSVKNVYVPPFEHPKIWEGNATLVEELARQLPTRDGNSRNQHYMRAVAPFPADIIICSIGGGGLFNGVIAGLDRHLNSDEKNTNTNISGRRQDVHVIAAETDGADSLAHSLRQGSLQSLSAITSLATHLGALKVSPQAFANALSPPPGIKVTSLVAKDSEAARGVVRLADETRLLVELACGVSVDIGLNKSALKGLGVDINPDTRVVVIVCGGSDVTPEMLCEYRQRLKDGWTEI